MQTAALNPSSRSNTGLDAATEKHRLKEKFTVAVVDDDPEILRALDRLIRSHGCFAEVFSCPAEFIKSIAARLPDCLILDVQMPGMSGLELHEQLLARGCKCPVIFITAHEDPAAEARAWSSGAAGFFYKPFRTQALWDSVLRAFPSGL